jgi:hypothetical protein
MLITLVLDDQPVRHTNQIDAANRALIIPDDQIAFRHRQPGQHQAEPQPRLAWGVHAFPHQFHRGTGRDRSATRISLHRRVEPHQGGTPQPDQPIPGRDEIEEIQCGALLVGSYRTLSRNA